MHTHTISHITVKHEKGNHTIPERLIASRKKSNRKLNKSSELVLKQV